MPLSKKKEKMTVKKRKGIDLLFELAVTEEGQFEEVRKKSGQTNTFDDDVDEAQVQDLTLNEDLVFQVYQCDAFDFDVDEAHTAETMFMANLSSIDQIYNEAGPSYDSDILSE
nr:integrase, catalytic region, zinc finger, CCHC-type, peptidase aspartic, catalytic [Tanacetum cinerariifolium]